VAHAPPCGVVTRGRDVWTAIPPGLLGISSHESPVRSRVTFEVIQRLEVSEPRRLPGGYKGTCRESALGENRRSGHVPVRIAAPPGTPSSGPRPYDNLTTL